MFRKSPALVAAIVFTVLGFAASSASAATHIQRCIEVKTTTTYVREGHTASTERGSVYKVQRLTHYRVHGFSCTGRKSGTVVAVNTVRYDPEPYTTGYIGGPVAVRTVSVRQHASCDPGTHYLKGTLSICVPTKGKAAPTAQKGLGV